MRVSHLVCFAVAVPIVAGCASSNANVVAPSAPAQTAADVRRDSAGPYLYAAAQDVNEVLMYPENSYGRSPVGTITVGVSLPWGLYVDEHGTLYVANESGSVTAYAAGSTVPSATYSQDLVMPHYPIVDAHGDLYVGNDAKYSGNDASIVEFRPGSTNAYRELPTPGQEVTGLDFDRRGDLYAAYRDCPNTKSCASVEKWAPGSARGRILGMKLHRPQGLLVDNAGNIIVADTAFRQNSVYVYAPGRRNPSVRVRLPEGNVPTQLAMTQNENELFVSSWNTGDIYVTAYPLTASSTWTLVDTVPYYVLQGIALSNGQVF